MQQVSIGIDLGGTKLLGIVMDQRATILHRARRVAPTDSNQSIVDGILALIAELRHAAEQAGQQVTGVGLCAPGLIDEDGMVIYASNLNMRNLPLRRVLTIATNLPTIVLHDGKAAALGEAHFGAGAGSRFLALVAIGTGIGAGLVLNGNPYFGWGHRAGEFGHMVVDVQGEPCGCGLRGCLETVAAGPAIGRQARQAATRHPTSRLVTLVDGDLEQITAYTVAEAAQQGDIVALNLLDSVARHLGLALAGMVNLLDLECILIGGGLSQMGALFLQPIRHHTLPHILPLLRDHVRIDAAILGNDAGAIGAASMTFRNEG